MKIIDLTQRDTRGIDIKNLFKYGIYQKRKETKNCKIEVLWIVTERAHVLQNMRARFRAECLIAAPAVLEPTLPKRGCRRRVTQRHTK